MTRSTRSSLSPLWPYKTRTIEQLGGEMSDGLVAGVKCYRNFAVLVAHSNWVFVSNFNDRIRQILWGLQIGLNSTGGAPVFVSASLHQTLHHW